MENKTVWVVQEGNRDYTQAEEFGEIKVVTYHDYSTLETSKYNDMIVHDINLFSSKYIADYDMIIPSGNALITALLIFSLSKKEKHRFLKWNPMLRKYNLVVLDPAKVNI